MNEVRQGGLYDEIIGDRRLCAWRTSETSSRIQTTDRDIAKKLRRLPDVTRVAYSVTGCYLQAFAIPYTLQWVKENVIEKFTSLFPKKYEGDFSGNRNSARFQTGPV